MSDNGTLSTRQAKMIAALMSEPTVDAAAKACGVGRTTVYRWLNEDQAFKMALQNQVDQRLAEAGRRLTEGTQRALTTLDQLMSDNNATVRLAAAGRWLALTIQLRDLALEQRLSEVERKVGIK